MAKQGDSVGCSIVFPDRVIRIRLPNEFSVFSAELYAIQRALEQIRRANGRRFLLCCDSLSALQSLQNLYPAEMLVQQIQDTLYSLQQKGKQVSFCWVPGHVGIRGNEDADRAAKEACGAPAVMDCPIPLQDVASVLRRRSLSLWEEDWLSVTDNKLRLVKPTTRPWRSSCRPLRRDEVALTRLRIGHCPFTHGYLIRREDPPFCDACGVPITVRHILTQCVLFHAERAESNLGGDLPSILADDETSVTRILKFCDLCGLWPKLLGWRF